MKSRAAVLLALPLAAGGPSFGRQTPPEALRDPAVVASHNGVLELTLTAARGPVQVGGRRVIAEAFNGSYFPPTLRLRPGDAVLIPAWVPHSVRSTGGAVYQLDVFSPPRRALLKLLEETLPSAGGSRDSGPEKS